jgi:hypothetical protein
MGILGMEAGPSGKDCNLHFKRRCEEYGTEDLYSRLACRNSFNQLIVGRPWTATPIEIGNRLST